MSEPKIFKELMNDQRAQDKVNYRRDGSPRKPFGRWMRKAAPVVGRYVKGAALGFIDGLPGVSQVASTLSAGQKVNNFNPVARVTVGWATVSLIGLTFLMRVTGHMDDLSMLAVIKLITGL